MQRMEDSSLAEMPKREQRMHSACRLCGKPRNVRPHAYNGAAAQEDFRKKRRLLLHAVFFVLRAQDAVHGIGSAVGRFMEVAHLHFTQQAQGK